MTGFAETAPITARGVSRKIADRDVADINTHCSIVVWILIV
jgi:hypothetical protein